MSKIALVFLCTVRLPNVSDFQRTRTLVKIAYVLLSERFLMIDQIKSIALEAIEQHLFPGCTIGVVAHDKKWFLSLGRFTYDSTSLSVSEESIYDVASLTKVVPVSLLAFMLIERKQLTFEQKLTVWVPEFTGGYRDAITIEHLLTQTLEFDLRLSACKDLASEEILGRILTAPLRSAPGTTYAYANATSILLGLVIERVLGLPLAVAAQELLFNPLSMHRTTFHPEQCNLHEIVPTELDPWRNRSVCGEVHDESAWALRPRVVGSAGLFSTAPDMLHVVTMLLHGGDGLLGKLFLPETVRLMYREQNIPGGGAIGCGWERAQPSFMGSLCSASTIGKTGFTGCSMVIDPVHSVGLVLLCNHIYPRRRTDRTLINNVRASLADALFSGLKP